MKINFNSVKQGALKMRALAHPLRIKLIDFIDQHKEVNVNKIYRALRLEQSVTSQQLKILRDADLVKSRRDGKRIFYSVNHPRLKRLIDIAKELEGKK